MATETLTKTGNDTVEYFTLEKEDIAYWRPRPDGSFSRVTPGELAEMDKSELRQTVDILIYSYRHFGDGHWEINGDEGWVTCAPPMEA